MVRLHNWAIFTTAAVVRVDGTLVDGGIGIVVINFTSSHLGYLCNREATIRAATSAAGSPADSKQTRFFHVNSVMQFIRVRYSFHQLQNLWSVTATQAECAPVEYEQGALSQHFLSTYINTNIQTKK